MGPQPRRVLVREPPVLLVLLTAGAGGYSWAALPRFATFITQMDITGI
jgi:hypothetical protein